ncbi:unnamed protein product [Xylocopa violacea]|uniref:Uncharacterized protein n=1 Tax=Xylocopa violacea TaxID=135666 RepID=A0ABP1NSP0_XYLVO
MAQLATLPMVLLLVSHALADIMVQPGYGQPHSTQQQPSMHPIVQPPETLPHAELENHHHQSQYVDPGYHLELHPVYTNAYDIPAHALSPITQQALIPPMSRAAYRRLLSANGAVPAQYYYQYLPPAVHSRFRRSIVEKRDSTAQRGEGDKHDVAAKSSLDDSAISVADSQSQDEKHVSARQSMPGTLLGLNPASMYPADQQYHSRQLDPVLNQNQEIANQQTLSQINSREATRQQHSAPQRQEISGQRNAPDPRPISASTKSSTNSMNLNSASYSESQNMMFNIDQPFYELTNRSPTYSAHNMNDKEMVGTRHKTVTNIKITEHAPPKPIMHSHSHWHGHTHSHGKFKNADTRPEETYANATPSPLANNEPTPNSLALPQANPQPVAPVYQLAPVQGTNYSPSAQYIIVPQTRPVDYAGNYVWRSAPTLSYRICFVTPYDTPSIIYQLA